MSVYVDPIMDYGWRLGPSCHMFADTIAELHVLAAQIGMKRSWYQFKPKPSGICLPHYDLVEKKRAKAVSLGAVEVEFEEAVVFFRRWYAVTRQYGHGAMHIIGVEPCP